MMKLLYKIMLFFMIFYMVVIMVHALDIFPRDGTFYSDSNEDLQNLEEASFQGVVTDLFIPTGAFGLTSLTATGIVLFIVGFGTVIGIATKNVAIPAVIIIGCGFFTMMTKSFSFFSRIFYAGSWSTTSLQYLIICLGAAIVFVGIITLVESLTHGRSG